MSEPREELDLAAVRARLTARGPRLLAQPGRSGATQEFQDLLHASFRARLGWSERRRAAGRRNFLKLMGASLALAGLTACTRQPTEHIMPYVRQPEELVPGRPLFFATAMPLGGVCHRSAGGKP